MIVRRFLDHKATPTSTTPPTPTIITFSPNPIYTTGRRELLKPISAEQHDRLIAPLELASNNSEFLVAEVHKATRGGQITFHGPGQLVVYPILDLLSVLLSPRCYVSRLEDATISTLKRFGINGRKTDDPGVWLERDVNTKIAALGVHLRRNVSSHGVGLNVSTDMRWFQRIVACGLEGKSVGSMVNELNQAGRGGAAAQLSGHDGVIEVGKVWVQEMANELDMRVENMAYDISMCEERNVHT